MPVGRFFEAFKRNGEGAGGGGPMLKLKDFPPEREFREHFPRYFQDFCEFLPCPLHARPLDGALNMHPFLPRRMNPPDAGPKTYIAMGRHREGGEGDSVTKLHMDISDAVNVLAYVAGPPAARARTGPRAPGPDWDGAGAVWDVFRREDRDALRRFLRDHASEFRHGRAGVDPTGDALLNQQCMLTEAHRRTLREEYGVEAWTFEQHLWEAVFLPAGTPHQVRNLRPCLKVAVDFVAPESVRHALDHCALLRDVALRDRREGSGRHAQEDKLQGEAILIHAAMRAAEEVAAWRRGEGRARGAGTAGGGAGGPAPRAGPGAAGARPAP